MPRVKKQDAAPNTKTGATSKPTEKKSKNTSTSVTPTDPAHLCPAGRKKSVKAEAAASASTVSGKSGGRAPVKEQKEQVPPPGKAGQASKTTSQTKSQASRSSGKGKTAMKGAVQDTLPEAAPSKTATSKAAPAKSAKSKTAPSKAPKSKTAVSEVASAEKAVQKDAAPSTANISTANKRAGAAKRQGRQPKAKPVGGEALPEPTPQQQSAAPEPVILKVPKPRATRGRQPKSQVVPELPDVLSGVQSVEVEAARQDEVAAVSVTHTTKEPLVDSPAANDDEYVPALPKKGKGKSRQPQPKQTSGRAKAAGKGTKSPAPSRTAEPAAVESRNAEAVAAEGMDDTAGNMPASANPEQDIVTAQLRKLGRPVHVRDLEKTFTRQTLERLGGWRNLTDLLEDLVESGQVVRTRKKTYGLPDAMSLVRGRFQASQAGFGFVIPDSGGEDYYVPADKTMEAWNGDIVLVRMEGRGDTRDNRGGRRGQKGDGNARASVVRIVQRAYRQLVGTLEFQHGHPILKPDDHRARHRILLLPEGLEGLETGARVVTELFWPELTGEDEVFGQVVRVLGAEDDPVTETEAVIVKYGLRGEFPDEVLLEAQAIPVALPDEALKGRLDLRDFNIFTVDGRDAKDFDDAIHIQPVPDGNFVVGIHIADVSHYVQEGTPLDQEAYARATSVYLPGRVLPMLPEHLSNGVCSLVPYQDRLTMTALVELTPEGDILDVKIAPSVINSKARLTYDEVQAYSEATATLPEHARSLEGDLHLLLKITSKLRQKRLREGSLDFKLREVKVDVDSEGRMELIPIREETARGMIEDLMLLANKVVAHDLLEREIPTLFRIHEEPTLQRFQEVSQAIGRLGLAFPGGEPTPQAYQEVLKQVRGTGRQSVVNTLLLRSMQQAKYAGENLGHFGLAFDEYLHFTSPIRRYPDLVVHRTLKAVQSGEFKAGNRQVAQFQARLPGMGEHTSDRERAAAEAERDLTKYYQCKWAQEHLGESFPGNVSGVVASGLYVTLENGVEGKLHISHLDDDYYVYLEDAQMLKGRRSGRSFRLGDTLDITISAVKPLARQIDLVPADPTHPEYRLGDLESPQERSMEEQGVKPRARRREDREAERLEKLKSVKVSAPRKFTLEDPAPAIQTSPQSGARTGGYTRNRSAQNRQDGRGGRTSGNRSSQGGPTFGGVNMNAPQGHRSVSSGGSSGGMRRVITLERPRNEHLRPVNITVQRMYFGDWTVDNLPPDEGTSQARGGRERGYNRQERSERDSSGGRGWTRGGSDRSAVRNLNGRQESGHQRRAASAAPNQSNLQSSQAANAAASAAPGSAAGNASSGSDESRRRRRRRGRRSGSSEST